LSFARELAEARFQLQHCKSSIANPGPVPRCWAIVARHRRSSSEPITPRTGVCFGRISRPEMKTASDCRFDDVSLGEVMLRLDPGEGRILTTRAFRASEGGGEYNVARGLRRCFGQRTAIVTALADNAVGRLIEDLMLQGGVDLSYLRWVKFDG